MARLEFYESEWVEFKESYAAKLNRAEATIVFKKLTRHYKLRLLLYWQAYKRGGGQFRSSGYVILPASGATNVGVLCHEVAHAIEFKKHRETHHRKRLMGIVRRVNAYAKKKGYWSAELSKRTAVKVVAEPSKDEVRAKKLLKRRADLARYEKRLAYFTSLYRGKIARARRSIVMLERGRIGLPNSSPEASAGEDGLRGGSGLPEAPASCVVVPNH